MADHASGRRSVVNPGTKLWRPPVEVTQFWRPKSGFGAHPKKIILIKRRGNGMKQKLLEIIQVTDVSFILMNLFCLVLQKRKGGPKPLIGRQN